MAVAFDIATYSFFRDSVSMLAAPADALVIPELLGIQGASVPFQVFASTFKWRQYQIPAIDTFPGNALTLYKFNLQLSAAIVVITAEWDGLEGVLCMTAARG